MGQTVRASYAAMQDTEREHFRPCMSVKALLNANMIAEGRKESTTKDLKVLPEEFGSCLASYRR